MSPHAFAYQDDIILIGRIQQEHKNHLREVFRAAIASSWATFHNPRAEAVPRRGLTEFARIVKPLNDLLRKGVKWVWTQDH